jgi:hypothetical protein
MDRNVGAVNDGAKKAFPLEIVEWSSTGEEEVEQGSNAVLICLLGRRLAKQQFRCNVTGRSANGATVSYPCLVGLEDWRVEGECQPEIEDLNTILPLGLVGNPDVAWL